MFPRLDGIGNIEVGHGKAGKPGFGARADAGSTFVADFTARTGGGTGKGGDGGGVVVGFHLHNDVGVFFAEAVALRGGRVRIEALDACAFDNRGVVFIRHHGAVRVCLVGVANHAEQRFGLWRAIEYKVGIEDFVAAVFGVGLGKHHQLNIAGVAPQGTVVVEQIVVFVVG